MRSRASSGSSCVARAPPSPSSSSSLSLLLVDFLDSITSSCLTSQHCPQPFAVQLIPGGLFAIGIPFFVKESPRWLISRGRRDEAIKNLCYLRKLEYNDPYMVQEVNDIDLQVENDRTAVGSGFFAPIRHLFSRGYLFRRMLCTASLFMWQNGTGINAINY